MAACRTSVVVITDLVESTRLHVALGEEASDTLRVAHLHALDDAVESHGGTVVKNLGDGVLARFDAASAALTAATAIQRAVADLRTETSLDLAVRVGVAVGDVTIDNGDCFGTPVVEAARLCAAARGGQIYVATAVRDLARGRGGHAFAPIGPLRLKGLDQPVDVVSLAWDGAAPPPPVALPTGVLPLPPNLVERGPSPFRGREVALDSLDHQWRLALDGKRCAALVTGEAGIGKSRLVAEFAAAVHAAGATVLVGRCHDDPLAPYEAFREALGPVLGGDLDALTPSHADEPQTARYELFNAIDRVLVATADRAPVVLVIEDVHWADAGVMRLLTHVLSAATPARLLVLATVREDEIERAGAVDEVMDTLRRASPTMQVDLGGLADDAVCAIVDAALGRVADADATTGLRSYSGGNPLFIEALVADLVADGWDGRTGRAAEPHTPGPVRAMVGRRFARLSPDVRAVAEAAAVLGVDVDTDLLAAVAGVGADATDDAVDRLVAARALVADPDRPGRASFTHALVRDALLDSLGPRRAVRLHAAAAAAIGERAGERRTPVLAALAHHHRAAGQHRAAVDAARDGAHAAMHALDFDEAVTLRRLALEALDDAADGDDAERIDLVLDLGEAQRLAGEHYRRTFAHAAALARSAEDDLRFADAVGGMDSGSWTRFAEADEDRIALVTEARERLGDRDPARHVRLSGQLAKELFFTDQRERRIALSTDAVAIARDLGDPVLLARALDTHHQVIHDPLMLDERLAVAVEAAALADSLDLAEVQARTHAYLVADLVELGDLERATTELDRCVALAARTRHPMVRWVITYLRAAFATYRGDLAEAERLAMEALEAGLADRQPTATGVFAAQLLTLRDEQGRVTELERPLRELVDAARGPHVRSTWLGSVAFVKYRDGAHDEARGLLREVVGDGGAVSFPLDYIWLIRMALLAEVAAGLGDDDIARSAYRQLSPLSGRNIVNANGVCVWGPVDRILALLAASIGDGAAARHFDDAYALATRTGAPRWAARIESERYATVGGSCAMEPTRSAVLPPDPAAAPG